MFDPTPVMVVGIVLWRLAKQRLISQASWFPVAVVDFKKPPGHYLPSMSHCHRARCGSQWFLKPSHCAEPVLVSRTW
jgi:hypothetical protein